MSEARVTVCDSESGPGPDPLTSPSSEASGPDLKGLVPASPRSSTDVSPSPSAEVCHTLGNVGKDTTAWQLRARRLIGSQAVFPVGPREDFDWPSACLEIEQLITCWTGQGMEVAMEGEEDEIQPIVGGDQLERLREELEERLDDDAGALMVEERNHRMVFNDIDALGGAPNRMENLADPRDLEVRAHLQLECTTLPTCHIAQVNSVLLLGGEGAVCATGSRDMNVKLWDLKAGSLLHTLGARGEFSTHQGWVWCLASQGPLLASGGFDSTVRLWDLQAGGAATGLIKTGAAVLCLSCQTDVLVAGTFDKRVSMYDTRAAEPLVKSVRLHGNAVMCLAADDKYIISGSKDCTVAVYDRRACKGLKKIRAGTLKPLSQFDVGHTALVTGIHKSAGSLYTCSSDCTVKLSVEAGVLAVASGEDCLEIWRPRN
ncbi:F-box/WD repeat-containing protein 9 [Dissostichus eleginoides]|uniref:F-box/WD repeat-containing protein 9 n=1 Tax=Dissostichus eleginoides TaxID=100907 RepID=A0AAD9B543_DISEL|nr:F-box/WD repeat-containing protein 9 [Dissostichus eleginoides]